MRSRNVLTGVLLGAGSAVGTLLLRRRLARRRERVDIYFGDGSMVSLTRPEEAGPLLRRAARIVELAG
jgi:TctA family transporter